MKIGFCGTMSCGKTTLVNALKQHKLFKDYESRTERSKYLNSLGIPLNTDSTFKGQLVFLAERSAELLCENIITDRTVIDVIAFSQCSESMSIYEKETFENTAKFLIEEYDYIFYISPVGVAIEDNGVRETNAEYRDKIDQAIRKTLWIYNHRIKNLIELSGSVEERVEKVISTIFP